jgi:hypothetical protein
MKVEQVLLARVKTGAEEELERKRSLHGFAFGLVAATSESWM